MAQQGKLSSDGIVATAMEMIDADGADSFSMRKLAARLGVDPMAIYHHHKSKAALMRAVVQAMLSEFAAPARTGDWRADLRAVSHAFRALAHAHPGTFAVYVQFEDDTPNELRIYEAFYAPLHHAGFPPRITVWGGWQVLAYCEGFAADEIDGWLEPFPQQDLMARVSEGDLPVTAALIDHVVSYEADAEFEFGLSLMIRGLESA